MSNKSLHERAQECLRFADEAPTPEMKLAWQRLADQFEHEFQHNEPVREQSASHGEQNGDRKREM